MPYKLAIIVSHPIQHFCPQYASLAAQPNLKVKVFFASALGYKKYVDPLFNREISWGNLQLDEFDHVFLNGDQTLAADKDLDAPNIEKELDTFIPDIVIVYGYFQRFTRRAYNWARKNKKKIAYISDSERRRHRSFLRELLKYPYVSSYFRSVDLFLSVGDANEDYYRHYGVPHKKLLRMHFSIDIRSYREAYTKRPQLAADMRHKLGIGPGEIAVSVVGKLVDSKNQEDIIEAARLLEARDIYLHILIIGSGNSMDKLKEKAAALSKSRVHFTGFVSPADLPAYYAASDIYIHPASIDAHPLAVCEAIYMGCPAIVSDHCGSWGPSDDVQEGRNGYVFRCTDAADLADKILLLKGPEKRSAFGAISHALGEKFQERSHGGFVNEMIQRLGL